MSKNSINIGTSGWNYKHWVGNFYPPGLKEKEFLKFYSESFKTVEINNTFYQLPAEKSIKNWLDTVPDNFTFAVKASRYITHMKRLLDPETSIVNFFDRMQFFTEKLGPLLFQFPPSFNFNPERLENFINVLPENYRYTFEFRNLSWFNEQTYKLLKDNNIAFCMYYMGNFESPEQITSDFVYIRFHGSYTLGSGAYSEEKLQEFSGKIKNYQEQEKEVFCYFNNDEAGYAVKNAMKLKELTNAEKT